MKSAPLGSREPLKVLLVEDSQVLSERLAEAIRPLHEISLIAMVDSEAATVALLARQAVDVIILDLHLKQGSGFGVLRALRERHHRPIVLVLTNYDLPEYRSASLALGATYFLDKAQDYPRLPDILRELIEHRHDVG